MAKYFGYGSVLVVATTTGGTTDIGQVRNISGPGATFDDVDTTCLDSSSNFRTFVPGLADPGEVTFEVVYDSTSESHSRLAHYHKERISVNYTIYHGSSTNEADTFSAYVKGLSREIPMDNLITAEVTLKVSGIPGFTT